VKGEEEGERKRESERVDDGEDSGACLSVSCKELDRSSFLLIHN
jgi:hypothetical protein